MRIVKFFIFFFEVEISIISNEVVCSQCRQNKCCCCCLNAIFMLFLVRYCLVFVHTVNVGRPKRIGTFAVMVTFRLRAKFMSQLCLLSTSANKIRLMYVCSAVPGFAFAFRPVSMHTGSVIMILSEIICKKPRERWAFPLCTHLFIWDRVYLVLIVKAGCHAGPLKGLTSFVVWKQRKQHFFRRALHRNRFGLVSYYWLRGINYTCNS